jgi:carboxyl-terminal processing protease
MLAATGDPHTVFLAPPDNVVADHQLNGSQFSGIGAIVVPAHHALQIVAPLPRTPAARAGLRAGDMVTRINGRPVSSMPGDTAVARIHGKQGTLVHLTLVRRHGRPFTVAVKRAQIPPVTAYGRMLDHRLGDIVIYSFGDETAQEVSDALHYLQAHHARGLVLDLRGNPGGYVDAAQQVVSDFLTHGVVAYEESTTRKLTALPVLSHHSTTRLPIAVLVDAGTASAAEITAGALRDNHRAVLIGTRTYGKGSMQSVYQLADGSSIRITDRMWLTPDKRSIQGKGIRPDITVEAGTPKGQSGGDSQLAAGERYLLHHSTG